MFTHRFKLFQLVGFQVWIDASWLVIGGLITWTLAAGVFPAELPDLPISTYWWMGIAAAIGLLFSIVFHEMAHSLVARHFGIEIQGITLFIFGGVAQMVGEPTSPRAEFLMALAGPVASLLLAGALFVSSGIFQGLNGPQTVIEVVWYLASLNAVLGVFNLAPAFPLDGGRMLRATLWAWRRDIDAATRIAAGAGDVFGLLLIALGIFSIFRGNLIGGIWQFLIGMFLRTAAAASYQQTMTRRLLAGVPVAQVMTRDPIAVPPDTLVSDFIENFVYRYHHREFPIAAGGRLVGRIGTTQVTGIERGLWPLTDVSAIAMPCTSDDVTTPETGVTDAIAQMTRAGRGRLFVVCDGRLIGVISQRDLLDLLSAKLELAEHRTPGSYRHALERRALS